MNSDDNACGYGTGVGVLAFLICLGFLIVDAFFENLSSVQHRRYAVLADLAISGRHLFMIVHFCIVQKYGQRISNLRVALNHLKCGCVNE